MNLNTLPVASPGVPKFVTLLGASPGEAPAPLDQLRRKVEKLRLRGQLPSNFDGLAPRPFSVNFEGLVPLPLSVSWTLSPAQPPVLWTASPPPLAVGGAPKLDTIGHTPRRSPQSYGPMPPLSPPLAVGGPLPWLWAVFQN